MVNQYFSHGMTYLIYLPLDLFPSPLIHHASFFLRACLRGIRDLLMGLGSVLEELRSELCEEIVGLNYNEVFAEVQTSPESIYSNVLEYTWQCYPAIKVDRNKYANPEFLSRQDFSDTPYMIVEKMPTLEPCIDLRGDERTKCTQEEIISYISRNVEYLPLPKMERSRHCVCLFHCWQERRGTRC